MNTSPVVVITGASAGIGAALARDYASSGARVALLARRKDRLEALAVELKALGGEGLPVECDVTVDGSMETALKTVVDRWGRLDVVVANAGWGVRGFIERLSLQDIRNQFETNVYGVLRTVRASVPELEKTHGRLAIVGSILSYFSAPLVAPYCMSKYAVRALAEALHGELGGKGISVTLLCPGYVETEIRKVDNGGRYNEGDHDPAPKWLTVSAESAAREIRGAIDARKAEAIITGHGKIAVFLARHFPWLVRFMVTRQMISAAKAKRVRTG